jgi:hypothetical protein
MLRRSIRGPLADARCNGKRAHVIAGCGTFVTVPHNLRFYPRFCIDQVD